MSLSPSHEFDEIIASPEIEDTSNRLGQVISGSLSSGLEVRLDRDQDLEDMAVGRYVVVKSRGRVFFGMITDIALDSTNPAFEKTPPEISSDLMRDVYLGTSMYGRLHISPLLFLEQDQPSGEWSYKPVKTIPSHYATVSTASVEDVNRVFGAEGTGVDPEGRQVHYFVVGKPLDMEDVEITLNLERFVERSSAVFGKSGTGKTFLSRLILAGIISNDVASNLIFDMHNEYGWEGESEGMAGKVKGLKQLFQSKVVIATLDDESSRRRGSNPNFTVQIGYEHIEPEDIEMLASIYNLSEAQIGAMYAMRRSLGKTWLKDFRSDEWIRDHYGADEEGEKQNAMKAFAEELGQPQQTLAALRRKFERFYRYDFITDAPMLDGVKRILDYLQARKTVVLEFGRYGNDLGAYLLVANFLTRRIHKRYVKLTEASLGERGEEPNPLVITIEEAHKFLEPGIASDTIFGTIARELRKYNVTLLVVDQRPSGIDPEVMSQVGTRVTLALDSEEDIRAVFMGVSGAGELRQVLARLDSKEQALILGHAVPMPVVVQTRPYDLTFYKEMGYVEGEDLAAKSEQNITELRGPDRKRLE